MRVVYYRSRKVIFRLRIYIYNMRFADNVVKPYYYSPTPLQRARNRIPGTYIYIRSKVAPRFYSKSASACRLSKASVVLSPYIFKCIARVFAKLTPMTCVGIT